jgi:phosphatidylserine synthase
MADESIEPKPHLVLNTDWLTAVFMALCLAFCLLAVGATTRRVFIGLPVKVQVKWDTWFLFLGFTWLALQVKERIARFGCILLSIAFGSRLVLVLVHASLQIQTLNAQIMKVVGILVDVGICCYVANWFKQRIRRV